MNHPMISIIGRSLVLQQFRGLRRKLDKNFQPSHQREDRLTKSFNVFHSCAIKTQVDVSSLPDKPASAVLTADLFLLSKDDVIDLHTE